MGNGECIKNFGDKTHGETFTWKSEEKDLTLHCIFEREAVRY
jgi:hypothetical protein